MKLKRIYASELYLTSTRKDAIKSAIENPYNAELVQQFSEYLDDDSKSKLEDAIQDKQEKLAEEAKEHESEVEESDVRGPEEFDDLPDDRNVFSPSYGGGGGPAGGPSIFDEPAGGDMPEGGDTSEGSSEPDESVEESTAIYGKVTADTDIENNINTLSADAEVIKGTLNSRQDTAGVQRITIDEKELWIYYKDEVNIGDIMVDVIELLNGTDYTYLTFSRLARSNNAIVFDISFNSQEPIKPITEVAEEDK